MIDIFGLGKQQDPQEPASESGAEAPVPRGSHKLWAFLLVLDSVFVIVFAGALAAKVYQHWKAPTLAPVPAARHRPSPPATPAPTPAPSPTAVPVASTEPAPAPEPVKAPEPPKPAPDAPRPPKPSMLAEAPKHRESPKPAEAVGETVPAPPPPGTAAGGKVKALRAEFKIHAPKAKSVVLVGAFIVRGGRKEMTRQEDGTWTVALYLNPGSYRYFYSVDKKRRLDPENPRSEKGASLLTIP